MKKQNLTFLFYSLNPLSKIMSILLILSKNSPSSAFMFLLSKFPSEIPLIPSKIPLMQILRKTPFCSVSLSVKAIAGSTSPSMRRLSSRRAKSAYSAALTVLRGCRWVTARRAACTRRRNPSSFHRSPAGHRDCRQRGPAINAPSCPRSRRDDHGLRPRHAGEGESPPLSR